MHVDEIIDHYHILDARQIGELLPDEKCIDVTITSPPYWNLKDYGYKGQIGFGQDYERYLSDIQSVFDTIYKRTKSTGSLWVVSDTFKRDGELRLLPFDISERLKRVGWILQDIIIWQKDKTLPWSHQGKLRNIFEYVAFYSKSQRFKYHVSEAREVDNLKNYWVEYPERYNPRGKAPSRSWNFPIPLQGCWGGKNNYLRHACPLPLGLIERIMQLTSDNGDIVLDPFAGSGSVIATAHAMKRRYIGVDRSRKYKKMFLSRVLSSIIEQYRSRNGDYENRRRSKHKFAKLIKSLRHLKYPRELIRLYRRERMLDGCSGILAFTNYQNKRFYLIFVFQTQKNIPSRFIQKVRILCSRPPLSNYGVKPTFVAVSTRELSGRQISPRGLKLSRKLFVYRSGQFYRCSDQITAEELCKSSQNGGLSEYQKDKYPPIFSTIKVSIDPRFPELAL